MPLQLSDEDRAELLKDHIPKERFDEATGKLKDANKVLGDDMIRLQEQVKNLQSQPAPTQDQTPVTHSRAQLRAYVEDEKITQEQADEIWDKQVEIATDDKILAAAASQSNTTAEQLSAGKNSDRVSEYIKLLPDLKDSTSDNKLKASKEYDALALIMGTQTRGSDKDLKMQVAALERAFGTEDSLRERIKSERDDAEHMESLGGEHNEEDTSSAPTSGVFKKLSAAQKEYYEKGIKSKRYKDWDAVKAELEYSRKDT